MAFIQVGSVPIEKLSDYEEGEVIVEGIYLGSFETKFRNPAFKFQEKNGNVKAVACGSLKYKMADVEKGQLCRIIYLGKDILSKGDFKGREFHDVQVLVDDPSVGGLMEKEAEGEYF